ncbi:MAG: type II secretion system protein GspG [Candidatus Omnitrophota bacterium]
MAQLNNKHAVIPACIGRESNPKTLNSQRGFTALELLVASIIILLLATTSVVMISRVETWANIAQVKTEIIQISMAMEMEKYDTGYYVDDLQYLNSLIAPAVKYSKTWRGPYLKSNFTDPWDNSYELELAPDEKTYTIKSYGADKLPGGTGLNTDITWHSGYSDFQD